MNKLLKNLLIIHEKIADVGTFMNIKMNVEVLDQDATAYKKMVENTDLLVEVLTKFGERTY